MDNDGDFAPLEISDRAVLSAGKPTKGRYVVLSLFLVGLVITLWLVEAEIVHENHDSASYFMFSYVVICMRTLLIVVWLIWAKLRCLGGVKEELQKQGPMCFKLGLACMPILYLTQVFWYASLPLMAISKNAATYSVAVVFVFLLSVPILKEQITKFKLLSVALAVTGIILLLLSDSGDDTNDNTANSLGITFCVSSAFLYATYEVILPYMTRKYKSKELLDDPIQTDSTPLLGLSKNIEQDSMRGVLILGMAGASCLLFGWIFLLFAHVTTLETLTWPESSWWSEVAIVGLLDAGFYFFLAVGFFVASPLFMAAGEIMLIPTSFLIDAIFTSTSFDTAYVLGVLALCAAFTSMVYAQFVEGHSHTTHHTIDMN